MNKSLGIMAVATAVAATGCGVKQADYATANQQLRPDAIQVWQAPIVTQPELGKEKQMGIASKTYVLGIPIAGDSVQGEMAWIWDNVGQRQLTGLAGVAAGRAIDAQGADGLYVSRIEADRTGIPPFYYDIEYVVSGYPVTMKDSMTVDMETYATAVLEAQGDCCPGLRTPAPEPSAVGGILDFFQNLLPF